MNPAFIISLYVLVGVEAKFGRKLCPWPLEVQRYKHGVKPSLQVSVLVSLKCPWVYVHVPLYKSGTLSVSPFQIVCLSLSPPRHWLACL